MTRTDIGRLVQLAAAVAVIASGCSNPSPKSSGLPLPSAVGGGTGTMSGKVTAYATGAPVAGATVRLGTGTTISDANGNFTLNGTPTNGAAVITAVQPGFVYRGVSFTLASTRSNLAVDLLPDGGSFSLTFYRQLVRNAAFGTTLEPLRRWTTNPNFYFRQLTVDTSVRVPDAILQSIQANFIASIPELSAGALNAGTFETGDTDRPAADGWVNVVFFQNLSQGQLGFSTIGGPSGTITIRYDASIPSSNTTNPYHCASIPLAVADHEISHTMGFWHTDDTLVDTFSGEGCPGVGRPQRTLFHAAVAYSRPIGNIDPDVDPTSAAHAFAPGVASHPVVRCDFASFRRR